jgi:hypothetical protein
MSEKAWEVSVNKDETSIEFSCCVILVLTLGHKEECVCSFVLYIAAYRPVGKR